MTRDKIDQALADAAERHDVRILYACESGSRAWGFASADSDWDVRFLYARPADAYLRLSPPRDVIEQPLRDDLDVSGWDLFKCCRLLRKSNPPLLEWLGSPIVYFEDAPFVGELRRISAEHFSKRACCEHYLSMAKKLFLRYVADRVGVRRKRYLYILRPLACIRWLLERDTFPPTAFAEVLAGIDLDAPVREAIDRLIDDKKNDREMGAGPAVDLFDVWVSTSLETLRPALDDIRPVPFPAEPLNTLIAATLQAT